ncbi:MAG: DJ-1/PfpI family protein [Lachnospiraceae bacterium]|nr:DJ-1/PfpI family protein [Lachnospiraceae bacterium]
MSRVYAFFADGLEEVEALAVVDMLRRGGVDVVTTSIMGRPEIVGAHGVHIVADAVFEEIDPARADLLYLPGGMPGAQYLKDHKGLAEALLAAEGRGQKIAAICAAPMVLGSLGLLRGRCATCYPGFEGELTGAKHDPDAFVVRDGYITTGRGPGCAIHLGLDLVAQLVSPETSREIRDSLQLPA